MSDLADKKCIPCEGGIPSFNLMKLQVSQKLIWERVKDQKDYYIIKDFKFENFIESQKFINKVGEIAEQEDITRHLVWLGIC